MLKNVKEKGRSALKSTAGSISDDDRQVMSTITVLDISNDIILHQSWRAALTSQADISLIDEVRNTLQLLRITRSLLPDVFLLDWRFQFDDGSPLLPRIHTISPKTKTILFCDVMGLRQVVDATAHGVRGLIPKKSPPEQWLKAIRVVHAGDIWINRKLMAEALEVLSHRPGHHNLLAELEPEILTKREWEVVHWVGLGMTNKEIARAMTISDNTVKTHLQHVFGKLKVGRRLRLPIDADPVSASIQ